METELPVLTDEEIHDVPPWRPKQIHCGISIIFTETDGHPYSGHAGDALQPGETLEKLVRRVERMAMRKVIDNGFPHEKHKQQSAQGQ